MRELGVTRLIASCLNDACRHVALIDVSKYPADTEVPSFRSRGLRQVRRPGEHDLGAADEKDAVQQAIERFEVPAALQNRLTVSKQRQVTRRNK